MHLASKYTFQELYENLLQRVDQGFIDVQESGSLRLFNYSKSCTYEKAWDDFTRMSRGLVLCVDEQRIVGWCLEKFHNFQELTEKLPDDTFSVYEKVDGSCIISFWYKDRWYCVTRGSFNSDQAKDATKWLNSHLPLT